MMEIAPALLDTDTLSALLRQDPVVLSHATDYLAAHSQFSISAITRYEILRGLHAKRARAQVAAFERFCAANTIVDIGDHIIVRAANIYGNLHRLGRLIGDADILIAATALESDLELVTNNIRHFDRIEGLRLRNWHEP